MIRVPQTSARAEKSKPIIQANLVDHQAVKKALERQNAVEKKKKQQVTKQKAYAEKLKKEIEITRQAAKRLKEETRLDRQKAKIAKKQAVMEQTKFLEQKKHAELETTRQRNAKRHADEQVKKQQLNAEHQQLLETEFERFVYRITKDIYNNRTMSSAFPAELVCKIQIMLLADGSVNTVKVIHSSGNLAYDTMAKSAVYKSSPFHMPENKELKSRLKDIVLVFTDDRKIS